jgi:hypothetical protein
MHGNSRIRDMVSIDEHKAFIDKWNLKRMHLSLAAIPGSLPPYEPYDPPQSGTATPFAADFKVRYLNFYFQEDGLSSPTDQPMIDPDHANWAGKPTGSFGNFELQYYPKGRLKRINVTVELDPGALPSSLEQNKFFLSDESNQDAPWMIQFTSSDVFRYPTVPPAFNPANVIIQWNTMAHLDAIATSSNVISINNYLQWRWQIDLPGDGVFLRAWDRLSFITGPPTYGAVQRLFVTGDIEYLTSDFSFANITHEVFVTTSFSKILDNCEK